MQGDADLFLVDRMLHNNNFFIRGGYCRDGIKHWSLRQNEFNENQDRDGI
jgi:hypothetical protein